MWFDISIFIFLKFIILGGLETQIWNGGSFENLLRHNRQGVYYVDQDYNGIQSDMPFPYCVISINYISYGSNHDVQAQAIAFNITNGEVKYKCVSGIGSDRDYPWRDVPVGLASFYKNYNSLSALASAIGVVANISPSNDDIKTDGLYFKTIYGDETGSYPSSKGIVFSIVSGGDIGVSLFIPKEGETSYKLYIKYLWGNWGNSWTAII